MEDFEETLSASTASTSDLDDSFSVASSSSTINECPQLPQPSHSSTPIPCTNWPERMQIPWGEMPERLKAATRNKKRPLPSDRRKMVRKVVDAMRKHHLNPNKAQCATVADRIVSQHPDSFEDKTGDGETLGSGYYSLLMQIKTRVEHMNRNCSTTRLRKVRRQINVGAPEAIKSGPTDTYGCVNWQPKSPPDGETVESLEQKRKELVQLFSNKGPTGGSNIGLVDQLMEKTYYLQRQHINNTMPLPELKTNWPYLFEDRWFCEHFKTLTGISIYQSLMQAFQKKGQRIITYLQSKKNCTPIIASVLKRIEETEMNDGSVLAIGTMLLVMAHFEEEEQGLFLLAEVSKINTQTRF